MNRDTYTKFILAVMSLVCFALSFGAKLLKRLIHISVLNTIELSSLYIGIILVVIICVSIIVEHGLFKGFHYFKTHYSIMHSLKRQMVEDNLYINYGKTIKLPKIKLSFSDDLKSGKLKIKNALRFHNKLDVLVMSPALKGYVAENHYLTDDGNWHVYQLLDASISYKKVFNSLKDFKRYSGCLPDYNLFLDGRTTPKFQHLLLAGQTGSGKTYAMYSLILQMLYKGSDCQLFFADPKGSGLAVIGEKINPERTASDVHNIIKYLKKFVEMMEHRKRKIKEKLAEKLDADYSDFGLAPFVFIFDEYATFISIVNTYDKKTRDEVKSLIYQVILEGRQLGFFLFIIMQKSDASLIDTALRDNIPLKIVLGNAEQQTYVTAFGNGVEIPKRNYLIGDGVYTEPSLAPTPKLVQFPHLNFDINEAAEQAPVVTTGAPETKNLYYVQNL